MGKDVARSTRSGGLAVGGPDPGVGSDLDQVEFNARLYSYEDDIPTEFRVGAAAGAAVARRTGADLTSYAPTVPRPAREQARLQAEVIASGARQLAKPYRHGGRVVQRRVGWQATPVLIVVTTAERELAPAGEGRYSPCGPWLIERRSTHRHGGGRAEKRVGTVPDDTAGATGVAAADAGGGAGGGGEELAFPEAVFALSLLPRAVRSSVLARVPVPSVFDGSVSRFTDSGGSGDRTEIDLVRLDATRAVVVHATRSLGVRAWEVAQASYVLGPVEVEQA